MEEINQEFFFLYKQVTNPLFLFCTTDLANLEKVKETSLGKKIFCIFVILSFLSHLLLISRLRLISIVSILTP